MATSVTKRTHNLVHPYNRLKWTKNGIYWEIPLPCFIWVNWLVNSEIKKVAEIFNDKTPSNCKSHCFIILNYQDTRKRTISTQLQILQIVSFLSIFSPKTASNVWNCFFLRNLSYFTNTIKIFKEISVKRDKKDTFP